jgi:hypothetical protein
MTSEEIPGDLRDFLLKYIDSVAQLEALLLLRRSGGEAWTAENVARRLYIGVTQANEVLEQLCDSQLLHCDNGVYSYVGGDDEHRRLIDGIAEHYSRHLIQITNLIHAKSSRIRQFAAAFKLRKDR